MNAGQLIQKLQKVDSNTPIVSRTPEARVLSYVETQELVRRTAVAPYNYSGVWVDQYNWDLTDVEKTKLKEVIEIW